MPGASSLEGNAELSQKAVDENRCDADTRHEYMAKLDRVKNDDEVAYAFFKFCMLLDLSGFRVDAPPRTALYARLNAFCWMCALVHIPSTNDQVTLGLTAWRAIAFSRPWSCSGV